MTQIKLQMKTSMKPTAPPKKHIVSAPRAGKGIETEPVSFRLTAAKLAELDIIAEAQHMSRSHLITEAIERCTRDNIWRSGVSKNMAGELSIVPPEKLVKLSNQLVALTTVVDELLSRIRSKKIHDHVTGILDDARLDLVALRKELGC